MSVSRSNIAAGVGGVLLASIAFSVFGGRGEGKAATAPAPVENTTENLTELEALRHEVQRLRSQQIELEQTAEIARHLDDARMEEATLPKGRRPSSADLSAQPVVKEGELVVYVAPICPFAHRAWIAAIEKLGVDGFRAITIDLKRKPLWYVKNVYEEGTVPAMQHGPDFTMGDSRPVCEWLEETYKGKGTPLFPDSPAERESMEAVLEQFGSKVVGPCYRYLKNQDPSKDEEYSAKVLEGVDWFNDALVVKGASPFFSGDQFSMFEVLTFSFFDRFRHTLRHWRGLDVLADEKRHGRLHSWIAACDKRPSIVHSQRTANYYIKCYAGYAKNVRHIAKSSPDA